MDMGLKGKIAIVTGGSMGLGRERARALGDEGVNIAIADIDEAEGKTVVVSMRATDPVLTSCWMK